MPSALRVSSPAPGEKRSGVDAVGHHGEAGHLEPQVGDRRRVLPRQRDQPVGAARQRAAHRLLVGEEQRAAQPGADEPVVVGDDQRRGGAARHGGERRLDPEDERVVDVHDVDLGQPEQARQQRRGAELEQRREAPQRRRRRRRRARRRDRQTETSCPRRVCSAAW